MSPIIRRRGEEFTLPSKYLLFILTGVCVLTIIITFNTSIFTGPLNSFAGVFVVPFQKGITTVGSFLRDTKDKLSSITQLLDENERLKEQIDELGKWEIQSEQIDVIRQFLRLDAYGRMTVKMLIQREFLRCLEQGTEQDISNIKIGIKTVSDDDKAPQTD